MSTHRHPHIDLWTRDEDGTYRASVSGWALVVRWRPESPGKRRGFWFEATPPKGKRYVDEEIEEEMEVAMTHAEAYVDLERPVPGAIAAP